VIPAAVPSVTLSTRRFSNTRSDPQHWHPLCPSARAIFNGIDTAGKNGLWVNNGTGAGTHEITGIAGADPGGLNPSDFTVVKNVVLFDGYDSSGKTGLWVTNGTAAGTHELTVAGAYTGLVGPFNQPGGLLPLGLTSVTLSNQKHADTFNFAADLGGSTHTNSNIHTPHIETFKQKLRYGNSQT
jgi:hypothetical protein